MTKKFKKLMRSQVQENIDALSKFSIIPTPKSGWIRAIRESLGMSSAALSLRLGCSQSNVASLEKSERSGKITLESLDNVAKSLNCKLVYYFIPEKPLEQQLEDRARIVARKQIDTINHSMKLEEQGLTQKQLMQQEDALVKELLEGNLSDLWRYDV